VRKLELLMKKAGMAPEERKVVAPALARAELTGNPAAAMELPDGTMMTGKTSDLLGATAAVILNALKHMAGIDHNIRIISPDAIAPLQRLKTDYLGSVNPRLHSDETLIALSITASTSQDARNAMAQISKLEGCQFHSSVMLAPNDIRTLKRLGIQMTCEPVYESKRIMY